MKTQRTRPCALLLAAATLLLLHSWAAATVITFESDTVDFPNPERGFYHQDEVWPGEPIHASWMKNWRNENITVLRCYFRIDSFVNAPLSAAALATIDRSFDSCRVAGIKIIPRFAYNFGYDGTDAPLARVVGHIGQLAPLLRDNADVIVAMEAGFIGAWGEWHSSDFGIDEIDSMRTILRALLDALPVNRMVMVRTNGYKRGIFGTDAPLGPDSAFCGSFRARTGAHNDCLCASAEDWGTYSQSNIAWEKQYLNQDNRYLPMEGETCNPNPLASCANCLDDLVQMRWDMLNINYHQDVLDGWVSGGCMDSVHRSLGYRFSLVRSTLPDAASGSIAGTIELVNRGWGKLFNFRPVYLVLRPAAAGTEIRIKLTADPRRWLADNGTVSVSVNAALPAGTPAGTYRLFLHLPDSSSTLSGRPEYTVRFANKNVWEAGTGYNSLLHTITIAASGTRWPMGDRRPGHDRLLVAGSALYTIHGRKLGIATSAGGVRIVLWNDNFGRVCRRVVVTP
jgi:hypothetical protein